MGSKGSSGSSGDRVITTRYAPYIEEKHLDFLALTAARRVATIDDSPYTNYIPPEDPLDGFAGVGYILTDFPTLYDMYGKFMAGLDIEVVWNRIYDKQLNLTEITGAVSAEFTLVGDALTEKTIPEFMVNLREMNAVSSSTFIVGKSRIECDRVAQRSRIQAEAQFKQLTTARTEFANSLNWKKDVTDNYALLMRDYYSTGIAIDDRDGVYGFRNRCWPFEVLSWEGANLAALQGARIVDKRQELRKRSTISKVLLVSSYTVQGAIIGAQIGGYYGAAIGGVIGFVVGVAFVLFE